MKPLIHAKSSARKYGGTFDDYLAIHDFMDSTKAALPDVRHRAILHSSFGCFIAEKVFGSFIVNSAGKQVSVRDIAEDHIMEDLGTIPTVEKWFANMPIETWMGGKAKKVRWIAMEDLGLDEVVRDAEVQALHEVAEQGRSDQIRGGTIESQTNRQYPPAVDPFGFVARQFLID